MSVWYVMPSAAPYTQMQDCIHRWQDMGYKVMVFDELGRASDADFAICEPQYKGWPTSINLLCKAVFTLDPECRVVAAGGDDVGPDPILRAEVIAEQFLDHFHGSLGVMQPTGDRWMVDEQGRSCTERVAGQPWLGREYCRRGYRGRGPFYPYYHHFFSDEELQVIAEGLGIFQQRPDLVQYHHHWSRNGGRRPEHLHHAKAGWARDKDLFQYRHKWMFVGSELLHVLPEG